MRPIKLELEGFTAFREFTAVDFAGADLFVLTGPTGSGKSSIIDAIGFALYGSVPRYANPNLVHPVISQGKVEAKVRFDFAVEDSLFTAVRVVRKTPRGGATTKEARLESNGRLLAGTADEMTRKVGQLLGLNFEQFTTCVVLPQGEFARFLHEKPAQRQDLLTKLLGVDIYEKMGTLARTREAASRQRSQVYQEELGQIQGSSRGAMKAVERRVRHLDALKRAIEKSEPELARLDEISQAKQDDAGKLETEAELLETLRVPRGVADLAAKLDQARASHERARMDRAKADDAMTAAERARSNLPEAAAVRAALRLHDQHTENSAALRKSETEATSLRKDLAKRMRIHTEREAALAKARAALEQARRDLAAHDLAAHLEKGEACPVCQRVLEAEPSLVMPPALSNAERDVEKADNAHRASQKALREVEKSGARMQEKFRALGEAAAALQKELAKVATRKELEASLKAVAEAEASLVKVSENTRAARKTEAKAHTALDRFADEEERAWEAFEKARDSLATLSPPRTDHEDLSEAWSKLSAWARDDSPGKRALAAEAQKEAEGALAERKKVFDALAERGAELDVDVSPDRPRDGVVSELAAAEQEAKLMAATRERAKTLETKVRSERESASVAGTLGQHLKSTGFERWLLEEAFHRLVSGATKILNELSSGQYSFEYDDKLNFEVVDHRNADERRSVRTLSGGETFLASLALALTLADQTADLAAEGSARPESLFLDEGFGTLDNDTLEIVATAMEDLGAKGRIVGLVTHQQSLADKIAVQFRVTKGPITATIERILT